MNSINIQLIVKSTTNKDFLLSNIEKGLIPVLMNNKKIKFGNIFKTFR